MLRFSVLTFGLMLLGIGLFLRNSGSLISYQPLLIWGSILIIAMLCERWRYGLKGHGDATRSWQETGERFEDPETGEIMVVEYDPVSGERRYVTGRDPESPSKS